MTWPLEFARMVYRAAINTRWEDAAHKQLIRSIKAMKKGER